MSLTKELAACAIYGLEITDENKEEALSRLQKARLIPVYLANGDPTVAVAVGIHKAKTEPWKFKEFLSEEIKNKEDKSTEDNKSDNSRDSYEIEGKSILNSVPQSRRAVIELVNMILSPHPIGSITHEEFLTEKDLYELVKPYFAETNFTCNQLNDWLGKEGSWGSTKRKIVNGERLRGRTLHVIRPELRDFLWNDISNVKEFRKSVRESRHKTATIGYVRKSKTTEKKEAVEKSINLQVAKMKKKLLCEDVFASCRANADDKIDDRDIKSTMIYKVSHVHGDCQDMLDYITMSNRTVRLVVIDYAGLSTNPDDLKEFVRKHKQLKEIAIDEGQKMAVFSRHELLKDEKLLQKFNCRIGSVKRS
ncbi:hypothetical protein INT47_001420, partial [Mucor saturninus]